ncbi:hypothetical protein Asp14428_62900 [Actinoplanes sp. NBRC 14428]|nr:hypothetical protein Asp14428_62900 [Actinoplanes sp. NBRC 14428]
MCGSASEKANQPTTENLSANRHAVRESPTAPSQGRRTAAPRPRDQPHRRNALSRTAAPCRVAPPRLRRAASHRRAVPRRTAVPCRVAPPCRAASHRRAAPRRTVPHRAASHRAAPCRTAPRLRRTVASCPFRPAALFPARALGGGAFGELVPRLVSVGSWVE